MSEYETWVYWDTVSGRPRCRHCRGLESASGRPVRSEWKNADTKRCTHIVFDTPLRECIDDVMIEALDKLAQTGFEARSPHHALAEVGAPLQYDPSDEVLEAFHRHWPEARAINAV